MVEGKMIRTIASIFIALALILGVSFYERIYVQKTFENFESALRALKEKTERGTVNHADGLSVREFWDRKKKIMHVWIPHTALQEIDYQLDEAIGFLYVEELTDALPKIEILIGLSENIPQGYSLHIGNIF